MGASEKVGGGAPIDAPRYLLPTILDEPHGLPETFGFRTSGWNAAPGTRRVMGEALPLLGVHTWTASAH